jgi:hypothetical protein|tara:strand:+ start:728 stop:919 length:192 start_codon:yes stop_codon:yes gene_type:complete
MVTPTPQLIRRERIAEIRSKLEKARKEGQELTDVQNVIEIMRTYEVGRKVAREYLVIALAPPL